MRLPLSVRFTYLAGWLLFAALEFSAFHTTQKMPLPMAISAAASVSLPGCLLGFGIWWLSGRVSWSGGKLAFLLTHLTATLLYSGLWAGILFLEMAQGMGWRNAWQALQEFVIWQLVFGVIAYDVIASASYALRAFQRLHVEEQRAVKAESLRVRAELEALKGKLQPHFLFNTLHTLTALVRSDPAKAEEALLKLGDVLRYVLQVKRDSSDEVPLAAEWAFVQQYLAIEQIRLGERLRVTSTLTAEALECAVPMFTLQPVVENAIHHAIAPRSKGGTIDIRAAVQDGRLKLQVQDDGPGAFPSAVEASDGLGLRVVRQRLETRFSGATTFTIRTEPGAGFTVAMSLPAAEPIES